MARTISRPSQKYAAGTYGPFSVDKLISSETTALEFTMSVEADWPADSATQVCKVTLLWDSGGGGSWTFNGGLRDRFGNPITLIRERVSVPAENDGSGGSRKKSVAGGSITIEVFAPITTALTLAGV